MPRFEPFRALRYAADLPIAEVTAPPYDVLSASDVAALQAQHARNIVTVTEAGAIVLPASPSFYSHPKNFDDLADTVVWRVLDQLGIAAPNACRWREEESPAEGQE